MGDFLIFSLSRFVSSASASSAARSAVTKGEVPISKGRRPKFHFVSSCHMAAASTETMNAETDAKVDVHLAQNLFQVHHNSTLVSLVNELAGDSS